VASGELTAPNARGAILLDCSSKARSEASQVQRALTHALIVFPNVHDRNLMSQARCKSRVSVSSKALDEDGEHTNTPAQTQAGLSCLRTELRAVLLHAPASASCQRPASSCCRRCQRALCGGVRPRNDLGLLPLLP
jgi:hypothetical protein